MRTHSIIGTIPERTNNWRSDIDVNETISVAHSSDEPVSLRHTFLFTDIEGSYRLWERHQEAMPAAVARHDAILHEAVEAQGGRIFKTIGDAVCAVFETPLDGARAAVEAQRALFATDWQALGLAQPLRVRMALQTGDAVEHDGDFSGLVLNRISRLLGAGHGGQVLLTRSLAGEIAWDDIAGVELRDLGDRRLRDVPGVIRIYQVEITGLPAAFPPLVTLDSIAHNLPAALNTCLDRESELAEMRHLLLDSPVRLVTLLGPGGIGKTRLALHAATQMVDAFAGGVWFVDLSGIRDAALMPSAVAAVLSVRAETGVDVQRALIDAIGTQEMLLLFDNCEQIVDGVAHFTAELLPKAPGVRVLATSRVPLELRGEQRIDVGPLPIEKNDDAGPAVQLFVERAQQIRPAFEMTGANQEAVFEICRRVEGIPLALELAAARVAVLSPDALRARLSSRLTLLTSTSRDLPERHQTLRGAIEWSYALLKPDEQAAFRALSVFRGGWSLAGAKDVLGMDDNATMEILGSLRDKSLIRLLESELAEPHFSMLETIQEYAFELLAAGSELNFVRLAHATYFVNLTKRAAQPLEGGPSQNHWLTVIDRELANIRAALEWSLTSGAAELALELNMNLWLYWSIRGISPEGQRWFERSLAAEVDGVVRSRALRHLGVLILERGEMRSAEEIFRGALSLAQDSGDVNGTAQSLSYLGMVAGMQGRSSEEHDLQLRALTLYREIGSTLGVAKSKLNLAIWARNVGRHAEAMALLTEVLELQFELQDKVGVAWSQTFIARVHEDLGQYREAADLVAAAEATFLETRHHEGICFTTLANASLERSNGNLDGALVSIEKALVDSRARGDRMLVATALEIRASIYAAASDWSHGARSLGGAHHLREITNAAVATVDAPSLARTRQELELALGPREFATQFEIGRFEEKGVGWLTVAPPDLPDSLRTIESDSMSSPTKTE